MDIEEHLDGVIEMIQEDKAKLVEALQSIVRRWDESERNSPLAWAMCEDARKALREVGE